MILSEPNHQSNQSIQHSSAAAIGVMRNAFVAVLVCAVSLGLFALPIIHEEFDHHFYVFVEAGSMLIIAVIALVSLVRSNQIMKQVKRREAETERLIGRDSLSGLPNRRAFRDRLNTEIARMKRGKPGAAVYFMDLDKFKQVNDTFGHAAGDELIVEFASRMTSLLRGADTLARFGGDEFAIVQTEARTIEDVEALARRILAATAEPFILAAGTAFVGVSIGIAMAPRHGNDPDALMQLADMSLYRAKNEGRNRFVMFAQEMDDQLRVRKLVEDELREAIERDELSVFYQPQVLADSTEIVGFEALVRWPHKTQGMIGPVDFIPMAEATGLINALGEWVLRRACMDAMSWPEHMTVRPSWRPRCTTECTRIADSPVDSSDSKKVRSILILSKAKRRR